MLIQFILIVVIVVLGVVLMRRTGRDTHLALRRLLFGLFVLAAVLSVLFPQWLSWLANLLGVGRGTDLLLYALVLFFTGFVVTQHRRNAALQRSITVLARRLALLEARSGGSEAGSPDIDPHGSEDDVSRTP